MGRKKSFFHRVEVAETGRMCCAVCSCFGLKVSADLKAELQKLGPRPDFSPFNRCFLILLPSSRRKVVMEVG